MKIAELFAEIKVKGGTQAISSLKGLLRASSAAKEEIAGAVTALYKLSDASRQYAVSLDKYEKLTGKSSEELQKLSYEATQSGVSMEELADTIQHVQQLRNKVLLGEGLPGSFILGEVDPNQDPVQLLENIRQQMKKLTPDMAKSVFEQIGLSDNIFYMLQRNTDETEKLSKKYILTKKNKDDLVKLNAEWQKLWFFVKQISAKLTSLGAGFQTKIVKILINAVKAMGELVSRFSDWLNTLNESQQTLLAIGAAVALFLAPFGSWLALATLVALILEDIMVYFEGGDSVTGRLVEWVKGSEELSKVWETTRLLFALIVPLLTTAWNGWKMIFKAISEFETFDFMIERLKEIVGLINTAVDAFTKLSQTKAGQWMLKKLGIEDAVNDFAKDRLEGLGMGYMAAPKDPITAGTSNTDNSKTTVTVYTQGGDNPRQTGAIIGEQVSDALYQRPALTGAN